MKLYELSYMHLTAYVAPGVLYKHPDSPRGRLETFLMTETLRFHKTLID